jgi:inward rectifier potassium channel
VPVKHRHPRRTRGISGISGRQFVTHGLQRRIWQDLYHLFMTVSWLRIFGTFAAFFFVFNLLFAGVYSLQADDIADLNPSGYWGRFFFSVETLATVGYGDMHPQSLFAHTVASIEIFVGLMSLALITGMMFARFSRPTARFMFARYAVIRPLDGRLTLMLRAANARQNIVMEAAAQLRLLRDEISAEGTHFRRIYDLPLIRSRHPVFLFGWTILHVIDAASPLAGATAESLNAGRAFLLLTLSGTDETTGQSLMAKQEYPVSALRWNHGFADILTTDHEGVDHFDYTRFNEIEPLG